MWDSLLGLAKLAKWSFPREGMGLGVRMAQSRHAGTTWTPWTLFPFIASWRFFFLSRKLIDRKSVQGVQVYRRARVKRNPRRCPSCPEPPSRLRLVPATEPNPL